MASGIETDPAPDADADTRVGPEENEHVPDADPHPDFPDDFDDDNAGRDSEEAVPETGGSGRS